MKIKKWLSLPIIVGGLLAFVPYNYFSHHHKITHPPTLKAYTMSYGKYLQDMRTRKSLANTNPMQLSAVQSDPPLLGYGYDLTNGTFSNKNAFSNFDDIGVKIVPLETTYSFESITSQNQLDSDLGVDGSMSFGFKHFALSGAASFQHQVINDTSDIHISFRMKTDVIELFDYNNKAQLSDKAKALVDSKDSTTFFNEYDAKYTTKLYATREVLFNLDMQLDSSVSKTDVKAKINFKKGLLSLEGAFKVAYGISSSNSRISMSTLALPGGEVIYPNKSDGNISGTSYERNLFLSDMQSTAVSYVDFDNDKTQQSNPSQYFSKGINPSQLDSYSSYYDNASNIINPNITELKEFPQLNQYYYLYENMVQDLDKLKQKNGVPSTTDTNNNVYFINKFSLYISLLTPIFNNNNKNFQAIFKDHNIKLFENEFKISNNIIFSDERFYYFLKHIDWFLHITYLNFVVKGTWNKTFNIIDNNDFSKIKNLQIFDDYKNDSIFYSKITFDINDGSSEHIKNINLVFSNINLSKEPNYISYNNIIDNENNNYSIESSLSESDFTKINSKKIFLSNKNLEKSTSVNIGNSTWIMNMIIDFSSRINPDIILTNPLIWSDIYLENQ